MAIDPNTVWEIRTTGAQTNGGGFRWVSLVNATYKWTASASGTNEYYCEIAAGGDPSLTEPHCVSLDGNYNIAAGGTVGSLAAGEWDWGDNDSLGYNTLYVRLANGLDPDAMIARGQPGYVSMGFGGGLDYSQQAAAQLALTDIATDGAGTGLSSATGGFTALMVGNCIYLTGGTATAGWYQITAYASTNAVTIDRSAGLNKSNVTGNVGGAFLIGGTLDNDFVTTNQKVSGNWVFIKAGTYAAGEAITVVAGVAGSPIRLFGYNASRGDNPIGDNRPLVGMGANIFNLSGESVLAHLRFTGTANDVIATAGMSDWLFNVSAANTDTGASNKDAFQISSIGTVLVGCEGSSATTGTSSAAFRVGGATHLVGCYAHDSYYGFYLSGDISISNSISDTCTTGVYTTGAYTFCVSGCTVYNCTTGYQDNNGRPVVVNCAFDACTTDIVVSASQTSLFLHNTMDGTTNMSGVETALGNIFADPGLADPGNGDFSITSADTNVYEQGVDVGYFTSATV